MVDYNVVGSIQSSSQLISGDAGVFMPVFVAFLVIVLGWLIAGSLRSLTIKLFTALKVNEALDMAGVDKLAERAGRKLDAAKFMGSLVKWFVITVFFVAALDIVGLNEVTYFFRDVVLGYLPKVIVAVLILIVAVLVAKTASEAVGSAIEASGTHEPSFFKKLTYFSILAFAVMAALNELEIASELIETLFMGLVLGLALAFGLAFGLGGKEAASRYLDKMGKKNEHHHEHHEHHG